MILGQDGNSLIMLMAILAIVFCIFKFIGVAYYMSDLPRETYFRNVFDWFQMPVGLERFFTRPWTILTYGFLHDDVFHFLGNILWLWAFGYILQDLTGNRKIIPVFIYGVLAGGLFCLFCYNIFPKLVQVAPLASITGASAGVMAIVIATTTLAPDYRIFPMINGGIPLWVLTVIFVIIDFAMLDRSNTGGHLAHLAGAAIGFVFVWQLKKGYDWSNWMNSVFIWFTTLFNPDRKRNKERKEELYYKTGGTQPFKKIPNITQKRIDEILDKINQQGYRFLTDEEKDILKRAAEDEEL